MEDMGRSSNSKNPINTADVPCNGKHTLYEVKAISYYLDPFQVIINIKVCFNARNASANPCQFLKTFMHF